MGLPSVFAESDAIMVRELRWWPAKAGALECLDTNLKAAAASIAAGILRRRVWFANAKISAPHWNESTPMWWQVANKVPVQMALQSELHDAYNTSFWIEPW